MVQLTLEQLKAAEQGQAVKIEAEGKAFVLLSQAAYEDELDFSPWSQQEMDLLADEAGQFGSQKNDPGPDSYPEASFPRYLRDAVSLTHLARW